MSQSQNGDDKNINYFKLDAKIVLLGNNGVGKSAVQNRYASDDFTGHTPPTIGVDFVTMHRIREAKNQNQINNDDNTDMLNLAHKRYNTKMTIWDTSGMEKFRSITSSYLNNTTVAILMYSIDNIGSFKNIKIWLDDLYKQNGDTDPQPPSSPEQRYYPHRDVVRAPRIILVGNKSDITNIRREVTHEEGKLLAKEIGADAFIEVSAKDGTNINELFEHVADSIHLLALQEMNEYMSLKQEGKEPEFMKKRKSPHNVRITYAHPYCEFQNIDLQSSSPSKQKQKRNERVKGPRKAFSDRGCCMII